MSPTPPQSRRGSGAVVEAQEKLFNAPGKVCCIPTRQLTARRFSRRKGEKKKRRRGRREDRMGSSGVWQKRSSPTRKVGEYTCIILHGLRLCVKSVMCCGEFLYCSESSCLTVAGELKQLFLKNYTSCLTRYTNSLLKN